VQHRSGALIPKVVIIAWMSGRDRERASMTIHQSRRARLGSRVDREGRLVRGRAVRGCGRDLEHRAARPGVARARSSAALPGDSWGRSSCRSGTRASRRPRSTSGPARTSWTHRTITRGSYSHSPESPGRGHSLATSSKTQDDEVLGANLVAIRAHCSPLSGLATECAERASAVSTTQRMDGMAADQDPAATPYRPKSILVPCSL
jgi:hypothetical protein